MPVTLTTPRRKTVRIGPDDDGRRMSLDDFAYRAASVADSSATDGKSNSTNQTASPAGGR
jgi:hypothetical protein